MSKSKWNYGASIPISSLDENELKVAMKEWAEGNHELEALLWECYHKKVVTTGSHVEGWAYVDFDIYASNKDKLMQIIEASTNVNNAELCFHFFGNPFSGPGWHKPIVGLMVRRYLADEKIFERLSESLNDGAVECNFASVLLEIADFLKDKWSPLSFRICCSTDKTYSLQFEYHKRDDVSKYFSEFFKKLGFEEVSLEENVPIMIWEYRMLKQDFPYTLKNILARIKSEWSYEIPGPEKLLEGSNYAAFLMRRKFGTDERGVKLMNKWLNAHKYEGQRDVNY